MTEPLSLRQRATLVEALSSSLTHGGAALGTVPKALRRLLEEDAWREFVTARGERVEHRRFADFVTTPPLAGLGADVGLVQRIASEDKVTADLLDRALQNPVGTYGDLEDGNNVPVSKVTRPEGNTAAKALRRLRKDAPELHAEVLAERMSAHAAMVKAGFRPKTISVPISRPESIASSLRRYMSPDDIAKLIAILVRSEGGEE